MKTYHDLKLKSGIRLVMARAKFCPMLGHQIVPKGVSWCSVKITVSQDGMAVSTIVDRKASVTAFKNEIKLVKTKLRNL